MTHVSTIDDTRVNQKCKVFYLCHFQNSRPARTNVRNGFMCAAEMGFGVGSTSVYLKHIHAIRKLKSRIGYLEGSNDKLRSDSDANEQYSTINCLLLHDIAET